VRRFLILGCVLVFRPAVGQSFLECLQQAAPNPAQTNLAATDCDDTGLVCCEAWRAEVHVDGRPYGLLLEKKFSTLKRSVELGVELNKTLCRNTKDHASCNTTYGAPACDDGRGAPPAPADASAAQAAIDDAQRALTRTVEGLHRASIAWGELTQGMSRAQPLLDGALASRPPPFGPIGSVTLDYGAACAAAAHRLDLLQQCFKRWDVPWWNPYVQGDLWDHGGGFGTHQDALRPVLEFMIELRSDRDLARRLENLQPPPTVQLDRPGKIRVQRSRNAQC
jgi:hypothetical protein